MAAVHLIGGGPGDLVAPLLQSFVASFPGDRPRVATVLIDEGNAGEAIARFTSLLTDAGDCVPVPVLVGIQDNFDPAVLADVDAIFVCGGLTPAYAAALEPAADTIRSWVEDGHPYAGFSAGAAIAAEHAIVGGWLSTGVPICHEDCAEDLDDLTVTTGLGLVRFSVDVHCAQWGTLSRAIAAVESGAVSIALGIDEATMLTVSGEAASVSGAGQVWVVRPASSGVSVEVVRSGATVDSAVIAP